MYKLKKLSDRHKKMIDLSLQGLTRQEVSHLTGLTPQAVTIIQKTPIFQNELARRRDGVEKVSDETIGLAVSDAKSLLENASLDAARTHVGLLESSDERVQQKSASEILDRVGIGKTMEGAQTGKIVLNAEQLNVLNIALEES